MFGASFAQLNVVVADFCRCFPHIVNLACKAVLSAITNLDYAMENAPDFDPDLHDDPEQFDPDGWRDQVKRDPIAALRTLIRLVFMFLEVLIVTLISSRSAHHHYAVNILTTL